MSRIGRQPISVPPAVTVTIENGLISVTGAKGSLSRRLLPDLKLEQTDNQIVVSKVIDTPQTRQSFGFIRVL